jgi:hypothetical protein
MSTYSPAASDGTAYFSGHREPVFPIARTATNECAGAPLFAPTRIIQLPWSLDEVVVPMFNRLRKGLLVVLTQTQPATKGQTSILARLAIIGREPPTRFFELNGGRKPLCRLSEKSLSFLIKPHDDASNRVRHKAPCTTPPPDFIFSKSADSDRAMPVSLMSWRRTASKSRDLLMERG